MDLETVDWSWAGLTEPLMAKLEGWLEAAIAMVPNVVIALALVLLGWFAARLAASLALRAMHRVSTNEQINHLMAQIVRIAILLWATFAALGVLNLEKTVTSLLAGVGVVGLALGFAFQDIAANFMSGILMAFRRPFRTGDLIRTNDVFGHVEAIDLRTTTVRTLTGEHVLIPNKDVFGTVLTNFTRTSDRRVDLECGVAYSDDLARASRLAVEAIEGLEGRTEREAQVFYTGFGSSSIDFTLVFWIDDAEQASFLSARSEAIQRIKTAFDDAGITIPFPIRTLDFGAAVVGGEQLDTVLGTEARAAK